MSNKNLIGQIRKIIYTLDSDEDCVSNYSLNLMQQITPGSKTLERVFDNIPGMLYRYDSSHLITYISKGCEKLTGIHDHQFLGRPASLLDDLIHPEDRVLLKKISEPEEYAEYEYRILLPGGQRKWVREVASRTEGDDQSPFYVEGYISDITEEREAAAKQFSEEHSDEADVRALLNGLPDTFLKVTETGKYKNLAEDNGDASLEDEYASLSDIFPETIAAEFVKRVSIVLSNEGIWESYQYSMPVEAGSFRFYEARFVKCSESAAGVVIRDVTESLKEREKIAEDRAFFENVINHVNAEIAVLDQNDRYLLVNSTAVKNDHHRKWIIGKDDAEFTKMIGRSPKVAEARKKMSRLVDELREQVEWLEEIEDQNGNSRFYVRTLKPFLHSNKGYKVGYGVDITALKVIQDELRRREHLLSFSHKLAKIGYWVYYPKTGKHEWSEGVFEILGLSRNSVVPSLEAYCNSVHPEDREAVKRCLDIDEYNDAVLSVEFRLVTPEGEVKYIKEHSSSRTSDTEEYIFGVVQDITENKQHVQEKEKLIKEINNKYNDLMQFNYIISHNLRSPVANILGMSSLFAMDLTEEERAQIYNYILESAESIDTVIRDLNHILSSRSELNEMKEYCNIKDIIHVVCCNLESQIRESQAVLHIDIAPEVESIYSIKGYIQSIIYNLVSNAIKYRHESRNPEIWISVVWKEERCVIVVKDNGMGIDLDQHKDQMFGLYKRFTSEKEGRGLGLHMTKTQVESLEGTINVESTPGIGTTFTITLGS